MFYVPTGTPHAFEVTSDEATFLVVIYKLGFENWFVELGEPVSEYALPPRSVPGEETVAAVRDLAAPSHVDTLGPPPQ